MPRIPVVTRTIVTTQVKFIVFDKNNNSTHMEEYTLSGTYKTNLRMLNYLNRNFFSNSSVKAIEIVDYHVDKKLYKATEQDFLTIAEVMPPRKVYNKKEN